jgi:ribulose-5-phosphate 4-epimerase/fuculose-1-phosphate aldolase
MSDRSRLSFTSVRRSVSDAEWETRVNLAACFRLADHYGMSDMIYTHITARSPDDAGHFLVNLHGMLFEEMTASSLMKVDLAGKIVAKPEIDHGYGLHTPAFVIHSAIYEARPDVMAVMHTHTVAGMALSSLECGLLPMTQTSHRFYSRVAYHDFTGPERDPGERDKLAKDLGDFNVMILRNHGLLTVGPSIPEAFNRMYGLERSCQAQLAAMACNTDINWLTSYYVDKSVAMYGPGAVRPYGLLEWPALLRLLDRKDPSYRE